MKPSFIALSTIAVLATAIFTSTPGNALPKDVLCTKTVWVMFYTHQSESCAKKKCRKKLRHKGYELYGAAYYGLSGFSVDCTWKLARLEWRCVCSARICWRQIFGPSGDYPLKRHHTFGPSGDYPLKKRPQIFGPSGDYPLKRQPSFFGEGSPKTGPFRRSGPGRMPSGRPNPPR